MSERVRRALASAKINLFLHVGPAREDGRHLLDSLVVFAGPEAADTLTATPSPTHGLDVTGPYAEMAGSPDDNLVLKAYRRLRALVRIAPEHDTPLHFQLEKHIPAAAGLGGGSADAAAALRLMVDEVYDLPARVAMDLAPQLGGDVLACMWNVPVQMRGDGDRVSPLVQPGLGKIFARGGVGLPALLVNPGVACSTGEVFDRFDHLGAGTAFREISVPECDSADDLLSWLNRQTRNDLEAAAIDLVPAIGALLQRLGELPHVRMARMSGSGASCFALFDTLEQAHRAEAILTAERPDWWVRATRLGDGA